MSNGHIIITGSSSGIGRALTEHYLSLGCKVTGIDKVSGDDSISGKIDEILLDLTSPKDVSLIEKMILKGELAPADCLILNAGISCTGPFLSNSWKAQERVIDLNLSSTIALSAIALRADLLNRDGSVVFISSMSKFLSYPGASVYAATKDGVTSWANSVRSSFKEKEIHLLTVFPGPTRTPHAERYSPKGSNAEKRMKPDKLAELIAQAVNKKACFLVPGIANKTASALGTWLPRAGEMLMRNAVFKPLEQESSGPGRN